MNCKTSKIKINMSSSSSSSTQQLSSIIPPNKVGRDYMYVRHVDGYHAIMSRHDCSEIRKIFRQELFSSSSSSSSKNEQQQLSSFSLGDLGCGTGRGTRLMLEAMEESKIIKNVKQMNLIAVDKSEQMIDSYVKNVTGLLKDAEGKGVLENHLSNNKDAESSSICVLPKANCANFVLPSSSSSESQENEEEREKKINKIKEETDNFHHLLKNQQQQQQGNFSIQPLVGSLEEFSQSSLIAAPVPISNQSPLSNTCNAIVCAWTLSHVMSAQWGGNRWHSTVKDCISAMERMLILNSFKGDDDQHEHEQEQKTGIIFIIETLGTDTEVPTRKSTLHAFLEDVCGFDKPIVVRTDYKFESIEEGEKMSLFFFGDGVRKKFLQRHHSQQSTETNKTEKDEEDDKQTNNNNDHKTFDLPECTGIWIKRVSLTKKNDDGAKKESPLRRERSG